jgi:hypothetical protein
LDVTLVCQFTATPVAVAFVVAIFVIVSSPGFPPPPPDALVKPVQPLLKSTAPTLDKISMLGKN